MMEPVAISVMLRVMIACWVFVPVKQGLLCRVISALTAIAAAVPVQLQRSVLDAKVLFSLRVNFAARLDAVVAI